MVIVAQDNTILLLKWIFKYVNKIRSPVIYYENCSFIQTKMHSPIYSRKQVESVIDLPSILLEK